MFETKRAYWRKLDNVAKLYSATSNEKDTRVFRFFCELREEIDPVILQEATDRTVRKYPVFLSVMRTGLFWHYLEKSSLRPVVREEDKEPCSNIYIRNKKKLLFDVTYYKNRINFEVYHALTDGTGATEFVRELVKNYIYLAHRDEGIAYEEIHDSQVTVEDQEDNAFTKYYSSGHRGKREKKPKAFQIRKPRKERGRLQITEAVLSVKEVLQKAREKGVSMTVYLTAVFLCEIHGEMTKMQEKRPVILMVPVNLRNYFPSASMLNFFGWIEPGYHFGEKDGSFDQVLEHTKQSFKRELQKERIEKRMDNLIALELNPIIKFVPVSLKNLGIHAGARIAERDVTAIFSNMSIVKMPEAYMPYIYRFGVFTSTPKVELCMCSFADVISLGFTSRFDSTNIKRNFFRILKEQGINCEILEPQYPEAKDEGYRGQQVFKAFSFVCLVIAVLCGMLNSMLTPESHWSFYAIGGAASVWLALFTGYRKRHNLMKVAAWMLLVVTVGSIIWDRAVGWRGWSVNYVLPIACMFVEVSMLVMSRIQKHSAREYMIYYFIAASYGAVLPFLLLITGIVSFKYFTIVCVGVSFLFLASLPIFKGREFKEEMHKKFHI